MGTHKMTEQGNMHHSDKNKNSISAITPTIMREGTKTHIRVHTYIHIEFN
jgi:hypothetical protein